MMSAGFLCEIVVLCTDEDALSEPLIGGAIDIGRLLESDPEL